MKMIRRMHCQNKTNVDNVHSFASGNSNSLYVKISCVGASHLLICPVGTNGDRIASTIGDIRRARSDCFGFRSS